MVTTASATSALIIITNVVSVRSDQIMDTTLLSCWLIRVGAVWVGWDRFLRALRALRELRGAASGCPGVVYCIWCTSRVAQASRKC